MIVGNDPEEWNGIEPERDITLGDKFFNRLYFTIRIIIQNKFFFFFF